MNNMSICVPIVPGIMPYMHTILKEEKVIDVRTRAEKSDDNKRRQFALSMIDNYRTYSEEEIKHLVSCNKILNYSTHNQIRTKWKGIITQEFEQVNEQDKYFNKGFVAKYCPELNLVNTEHESHDGMEYVKNKIKVERELKDKKRLEEEQNLKNIKLKEDARIKYNKLSLEEVYDEAHRLNRHWEAILSVNPENIDIVKLGDSFE
jgi:hypothetical protein